MSTVHAVLRRFESQLGVVEDPFGSNFTIYNDWYFGRHQAAPWCATFLSWCFYHENLPLSATIEKGFAYTPSGAAWFKKSGRWANAPKIGHVAFFDFPNDGVNRISHVGIVTAIGSGYIDTIEGNTDESGSRTGGKVMRRRRSVGIVGYGIPNYTKPTPEEVMVLVVNARGFAVMENQDIVVVDWDGAAFHFDADGVHDEIGYADAYNAHPELWGGSTPRSRRECIGVYPIYRDGRAAPNGAEGAVGYCQVFSDGARYRWVRP